MKITSVVLAVACVLTLAVLLVASADVADARADEPSGDFTELPLEDLLNINVVNVNVLGTHTHFAGQRMIAVQSMFMRMDGLRDGTKRVSTEEVLAQEQPVSGGALGLKTDRALVPAHDGYLVTGVEMDMAMQMVSAMYAPTDGLTLMAMVPYVRRSMLHKTRDGASYSTKSSGIGDVSFTALYTAWRADRDCHRLMLNSAVSIPTGSIDETDLNLAGEDHYLSYSMQNGSGTFDLMPGLTYVGEADQWAWDADGAATLRLGRNDRDYSLGNRYRLGARLYRRIQDWVSVSGGADGDITGNVDGADSRLDVDHTPMDDPQRQGSKRVDILGGLTFFDADLTPGGGRLAIEVSVPVYENLDGPALETAWMAKLGAQIVF